MDYIKLFVKNPSYAIDTIFLFDFIWRKRISHLNIPLIIHLGAKRNHKCVTRLINQQSKGVRGGTFWATDYHIKPHTSIS